MDRWIKQRVESLGKNRTLSLQNPLGNPWSQYPFNPGYSRVKYILCIELYRVISHTGTPEPHLKVRRWGGRRQFCWYRHLLKKIYGEVSGKVRFFYCHVCICLFLFQVFLPMELWFEWLDVGCVTILICFFWKTGFAIHSFEFVWMFMMS